METDVSITDLRRVIREIAEQSRENDRRLADSAAQAGRSSGSDQDSARVPADRD
jgi:hypothetical protein